MTCNCKSYNKDVGGTVDPVILNPNEYFNWDSPAKNVPVDACIASEIEACWKHGIWTRGSCCGHGTSNPSVIIDKGESIEDAVALVQEIDPDRVWNIMKWKLVSVATQ